VMCLMQYCTDVQASYLILLPPSRIAGRYLREGFRSSTYDGNHPIFAANERTSNMFFL
jgi:hypothetical protein